MNLDLSYARLWCTQARRQAARRRCLPPNCSTVPSGRAYSTTFSMSSMVRGAHARHRSQWTRSRCCSLPLPCCALHDSGGCGLDAAPSNSMPWPIVMGPAPSTATDPTSLPRHSARGICAHPEGLRTTCMQLERANHESSARSERCASPLRHRLGCWGQWRSHGSAALQAPHGSTGTVLGCWRRGDLALPGCGALHTTWWPRHNAVQ